MVTSGILYKKNIRRFSALIMSVTLCVASLTGCSGVLDELPFFSEDVQEENVSSPDNKTSPDIIIVEKVEDLDKADEKGTELSQKDFDKAKEELLTEELKFYAYDKLDDDEKVIYTEILSILNSLSKDTKVSSKDPEQIEKIFNYVMFDHPELFYLTGYSFTKYMRGGVIEKITLSGTYTMNEAEVKSAIAKIDAYTDKCLAGYSGPVDEYEKVKYVFNYIVTNTEYDLLAPNNQNILSVVEEGRTVCQGYAKMMQYILNKMGVFCILCEGIVKGTEAHVWNIVRIDGKYYHVDATWGDSSYNLESEYSKQFSVPTVNYDFLNLPDSAIKLNHVIKDGIEYPVCDSMDANYYVREGLYFTEVDTEKLRTAFDNARYAGEEILTLKCENVSVYTALKKHLIEDHKVFDYLGGSTTVNYVEFLEDCRISFYI